MKNNVTLKIILPLLAVVIISIIGISIGVHSLFAQTSIDEQEKLLREQLDKLTQEEQILQVELNKQKTQSASIQRDVSILSNQINTAQISINKSDLQIRQLDRDITLREQTVSELNDKLERGKEGIGELLRETNSFSQVSLAEIVLSHDNLSDFFAKVDAYERVRDSLEALFDDIRNIQGVAEEEKVRLKEKQDAELNEKARIASEKKTIEVKEAEKQQLLSVSKNTEAAYQDVIATKQAQAASIRAALFQLRDTAGISFGDAVIYAKEASKRTGVRPAFILGILKQESNIGQNVGSCVITDLASGATKGINSGTVFTNGIHPTRDLPSLQTIVKALGRDPLTTKVSCPFNVGYGGAMGPSQFIPSTWSGYISRLQQLFGVYPDPWNAQHAITATALFVSDLGASAQTYTAEREAAGRYYAGGNWQTLGLSYAASVLSHAQTFQEQIDFLADVE